MQGKTKPGKKEAAVDREPLNLKEAEQLEAWLSGQGQRRASRQLVLRSVRLLWQWLNQEGLDAEAAGYNDMLCWLKWLRNRGQGQRTQQMHLNGARHYFEYLRSSGVLLSNPCRGIRIQGVKRRRLYDVFSAHQLRELYEAYAAQAAPKGLSRRLKRQRNQVMLGLILLQGLDSGELAALKPEDLELKAGCIGVRGSARSAFRRLPLAAFQVMDLMDYCYQTRPQLLALQQNRQDEAASGGLIISTGGSRGLDNTMQGLLEELRRLNSRVKHFKQLRASVISGWLQQYPLRKVQYLAGHRYVSSTESYRLNNLEGLREDISRFHPDN